jgi:hypothetical protein
LTSVTAATESPQCWLDAQIRSGLRTETECKRRAKEEIDRADDAIADLLRLVPDMEGILETSALDSLEFGAMRLPVHR